MNVLVEFSLKQDEAGGREEILSEKAESSLRVRHMEMDLDLLFFYFTFQDPTSPGH